jgi:N-acetyl-anhydromuramyl-L-alanine amidase AmpD
MSIKVESKLSPHWDNREGSGLVDTVVIHSMYARDFPECFDVQLCANLLEQAEVSAHYLIGRDGEVLATVPEESRAWHAGVSLMPQRSDQRTGVNHFSIGIELIGSEISGFTDKQYEVLVSLLSELFGRHPITSVVSHSDIAPDRKTDPWCFDWQRLRGDLLAVVPIEGVWFSGIGD